MNQKTHTPPAWLSVASLVPHPKNPRIGFREDKIGALVAALSGPGGFDENKPLVVRRKAGDVYEIVEGHHRHEAAKRAKLDQVPCVIVELTDAEALKQLALGNLQSEMTALEYGINSLDVAPAKGKAGEGHAAYARALGLDPSNLARYRMGATVFLAIRESASGVVTEACRDKAEHLAQIHRLPKRLWPDLATKCIKEKWSVRKAREEMDALVAAERTPKAATVKPVRAAKDAAPEPDSVVTVASGESAIDAELDEALAVLSLAKPTSGTPILFPSNARDAAIAKIARAYECIIRYNETVCAPKSVDEAPTTNAA